MTSESDNASHQQQALAFLHDCLGDDAPDTVTCEGFYPGRPLEREGDMSVCRFRASIGGGDEQDYWVVAGQTEPNYYPHWQLTPDDVYELHLGTRFMLVLNVAQVPDEQWPQDTIDSIRAFLASAVPGQSINQITLAAAFHVEQEIYAVCRAQIAGEPVYVLGYHCPPGIYRDTHLPPHVIFRRHIGRHIRREAEFDASEKRKNCD